MFLGHAIGRRSDEHPVEAGSREGAAGDLRRRKRDMPIGRAVRRKSHDARGAPASDPQAAFGVEGHAVGIAPILFKDDEGRSEEHTSELQSLMRISYAVFCLKK